MTLKNLGLFIFILSLTYCAADIGCPDPIFCLRCIDKCPAGEVLVKSACGCCFDQCVPKEKCPDPPIQCFVCHWSCPANETMHLSPCGCCYNKCVPIDSECPPNICQLVDCALPQCPKGQILVQGAGYCGCCPGCVTPTRGDKCYPDFNTGTPTCGAKLKCCNGICVPLTSNCPRC